MIALHNARDLAELAKVAVTIAERLFNLDWVVIQICGPMTTGGLGNEMLNRKRHGAAIELALKKGHIIFDQRPFESKLRELKAKISGTEYCQDVLDVFYQTIFASGYITRLWILSGSEGSRGVAEEIKLAGRLGIGVEPLPQDCEPVPA